MQTDDYVELDVLVSFDEEAIYVLVSVLQRGQSVILQELNIIQLKSQTMSIFNWLNSFGPVLKKNNQEDKPLVDLSYKYIGLYFTATWCSYCVKLAQSMPDLIARVNSQGHFFRVLTVRLDEDGGEFGHYDLKFKSLSHDGASEIAGMFDVFRIPTLLVYDYLGRLVTKNGYQEMMKYKEKTMEYWDKKMDLV